MVKLYVQRITGKDEDLLALKYSHSSGSKLDTLIRSLPERRYNKDFGLWYIPYREDYKIYFDKVMADIDDLEINYSDSDQVKTDKNGSSNASVRNVLIKIDEKWGIFTLDHGYNPDLYTKLSRTGKGKWLKKEKSWLFVLDDKIYTIVKEVLEKTGYSITKLYVEEKSHPKSETKKKTSVSYNDLPVNMKQFADNYNSAMTLKRLSKNTRDTYSVFFFKFLIDHKDSDINQLAYKDILEYVRSRSKNLGETQLRQTIAAIKFYYERVLGWDKMFFYVKESNEVKKKILYLPLSEIETICEGINVSADKMMLFLVYHANLNFNTISKLRVESEHIFEKGYKLPGDDPEAIAFFRSLLRDMQKKYHNQQYLFEEKGDPYDLRRFKIKFYRLLGNYRLESVYRKQYKLILDYTKYSEKTRQMYLGAFMKFLHYFN